MHYIIENIPHILYFQYYAVYVQLLTLIYSLSYLKGKKTLKCVNFHFENGYSSRRKQPKVGEVSRQRMSQKRAQKFHTDDASLPRSMSNFPHGMTNQKYSPDLASDASSVWNFCACFSDIICWGNKWKRRQTLAVFSG